MVDAATVRANDAHVAKETLAHELCRPALSQHDFDTLVETVDSSGLGSRTMPSQLLDELVTSAKTGEELLSEALAREVVAVARDQS